MEPRNNRTVGTALSAPTPLPEWRNCASVSPSTQRWTVSEGSSAISLEKLHAVAHHIQHVLDRADGRLGNFACATLDVEKLTIHIHNGLTDAEWNHIHEPLGRARVCNQLMQQLNEMAPQCVDYIERLMGCAITSFGVDVAQHTGEILIQIGLRNLSDVFSAWSPVSTCQADWAFNT